MSTQPAVNLLRNEREGFAIDFTSDTFAVRILETPQNPSWSLINDSQIPMWAPITDSQSPNWSELAI
jgi:hypothetical protein